jgi:hypothetical protein
MNISLNILNSNLLSLHLSEVLTHEHNFGIHYLDHVDLNCYRGSGMNFNRLTIFVPPQRSSHPIRSLN